VRLGLIAGTAAGCALIAATTTLAIAPRTDKTDPSLSPGSSGSGTGAPKTDPRMATIGEPPPEPKQRGVALGLFSEDVGFSYVPLLREIAALGATHVSLIVPVYQTDGRSTDLNLHTRFSPTLGAIADAIRAARRERLEVMLFPIVRLSRPAPGEWRGTLAPANRDRWFRAYRDVLGDLAAVAAQTGATRLVIGSELSTLDGDLDRWRPLLERIRAVFPGRLVYSANWDHYREARLFDLVDEEGVVGYFALRDGPRAPSTEEALEAAWRRQKEQILAWHDNRQHPLVFTEVGYRSRLGSTIEPWDETPGGTPDLDEQRRAFAAFRRVWAGTAALDGVYVWNWYGWGGPTSIGYTPRKKPAAEEVRRLLESL
jgi:hypothetical protein